MSELHRIYFDLDSILDTRIATLSSINEDAAFRALVGGYFERTTDDPAEYTEGITHEQFKETYAKRDIKTLKQSKPTQLAYTIGGMLKDLELQAIRGNIGISECEIILNVWPYRLTQDQKISFIRMMKTMVTTKHDFRVWDLPVGDFTLRTMLNENISNVYMYDFNQWYCETLAEGSGGTFVCTEGTTIYAPALKTSYKEANEIIDGLKIELGVEEIDVGKAMAEMHQEWFFMEMTRAEFFSISPHLLIPTDS